jgi:hypothetical protein
MIKATEFRIGNLVRHQIKEGKEWRIVSIEASNFPFLQLSEKSDPTQQHYQPIPLTTQLLETVGFKRPIVDGEPIPFYKRSRYTIFEISPAVFEFTIDHSILFKKMSYLHQLQNVYYFMVDEELQVDITAIEEKQ